MKPILQIPLLRWSFQGWVILAVLLTLPTNGGTAEPKRSKVPSPLEMAAILREGSEEECCVALNAVGNSGPLSREMAEVLAQGMKPRSRRIQKIACLVLSDGKVDSQIVTSAILDAATSESLDLSRNATWSLKKIGISADTAAMIATRAGDFRRPEPIVYVIGDIRNYPEQVARILTENNNVPRLLDDRKVCLHDLLPEMIASPDPKWQPVRKWAETTEFLPANVAVMLGRKDHRAAIEGRAKLAEGIQKRYLEACAAALGSTLPTVSGMVPEAPVGLTAELQRDNVRRWNPLGCAAGVGTTTDLKWDNVTENKAQRKSNWRMIERGFFSTLIAFDLQTEGVETRPECVEIFYVSRMGERKASKQGYDRATGRAYAVVPFTALYDLAALEILDTLPLEVQRMRLRVKSPGHESCELVAGYATSVIRVNLTKVDEELVPR